MADLPPEVAAAAAGREPLAIADHGAPCCILARTWLEGLDATYHRGAARAAVPAWIGLRFGGGAAVDELHWCEIPDAALCDDAAAALGRELWRQRCDGVRTVQLITADLAYREAMGLARDGRLEVWDAGAWLRPDRGDPTLAIRVTGGRTQRLRWGAHVLATGSWTAPG